MEIARNGLISSENCTLKPKMSNHLTAPLLSKPKNKTTRSKIIDKI
jgi:hypothetical protein